MRRPGVLAIVLDTQPDSTDMVMGPPHLNCGIESLVAGSALDATKNFWGAASGPGADPGDDFCRNGLPADGPVEPVATKEIVVKPKAAK